MKAMEGDAPSAPSNPTTGSIENGFRGTETLHGTKGRVGSNHGRRRSLDAVEKSTNRNAINLASIPTPTSDPPAFQKCPSPSLF